MSSASFLYPHLREPTESSNTVSCATVQELADAAIASWIVGTQLDTDTLAVNNHALTIAANAIAASVIDGGRILVIGNGGSACDADRLVRLLGSEVGARSMLDPAVLSAVANDVGASRMFERQVESFAQVGDVVVAFSTSGTSPNIISALSSAIRVGAIAVAFAGYGGATLRGHDRVICLTVDSESVHRIQEAQGALSEALVERVHAVLGTSTLKARI